MAEGLIGLQGVEHVAQPQDSELCFASIMSAVDGRHSIDEAHIALVSAELSEADGSTPPMGEAKLQIVDGIVVIDPFQSPFEGAEDPDGVLKLMDGRFQEGEGVVLLHKKNDAPDDERYHWTLFTGYDPNAGEDAPLRTIDPLLARATFFRRPKVAAMVKRSMDYNGVFAYGVSRGA